MEISLPLIIQLICGAVGGNIAGSIIKNFRWVCLAILWLAFWVAE